MEIDSSEDEISREIRERIQLVYDPGLLKSAMTQLAAELGRHLDTVQHSRSRVLNWAPPEENIARAEQLARCGDASMNPREILARFESLVREALSRGHNLHDPRYVGHQVPAPVPFAGLFDAIGSITNQVMAVYEMGPWATAVELAMVKTLAEYLGWKEGTYAGYVTHGASLANLNALLAARNVCLENCWEHGLAGTGLNRPVLLVQADTHYSIARSAGILGLGTEQVIKVGLDKKRRMNGAELDQLLSSLRATQVPVVAVVACACSTPIGAFDPLSEIADLCEKHRIWLHVDAAHGGSALVSHRHRHLVRGLERADSLVWDAHKMLFVPALCAFLYFKSKLTSYSAFKQNAPYLFDPAEPGLADYDLGLRTVECTKRAAVYGLWGVWSMFGPRLFEDMVDVTFSLGQTFYRKLLESDDFEPLHEPQCNILVFRHLPESLRGLNQYEQGVFQRKLRRKVIESGEFYLVATNLNGIEALRVTLINPLTTPAHLDQLMETLRRVGAQLLAGGG